MDKTKAAHSIVMIHYAEIALKGKNRLAFENRLMKNIRKKLAGIPITFSRESGVIVSRLRTQADTGKIHAILSAIPGIAYFSFAIPCPAEMEAISEAVVAWLKHMTFDTFRITTKRRDKRYPISSMAVSAAVGQEVARQLSKKARMASPDVDVKIEITGVTAYISIGDIPGVGGMPSDESQKVVSLLSGGYDSPVAAYMMMKRGCAVTLVHFQNRLQSTGIVEDKIVKLAERLSAFQTGTRLFIVPFEDIQQAIIMNVPARQRMLIYRKFMIRMAAWIAGTIHARFLVTGDNLSQVASQTYDNLAATYRRSPLHIFTPLIGMDKIEIIEIARKIGTYEISILPYGDCCSFFIPKHPELHASPEELERMESLFDIPALVSSAISQAKITDWN